MFVLEEYKFLQKLMGLNPQGGFANIVVRVISLVSLLSCDLMLLLFVVFNIHNDLYGALTALPATLGFTLLLTTYLYLLIRREQFFSVLNELQDIVNESTRI